MLRYFPLSCSLATALLSVGCWLGGSLDGGNAPAEEIDTDSLPVDTDGVDSDSATDPEPDTSTEPCSLGVWEGKVEVYNAYELDAFEGYTEITGHLEIGETDLINLDALHCLERVGKYVNIHRNDDLTNIDGLAALTEVGLGVSIGHNDSLINIDGLSGLTTLLGETEEDDPDDWFGGLGVDDNPALESLDGLSNLEQATTVTISDCPALESLDGLANLDQVTTLKISHCSALTDLDGLSSLSVADRVFLGNNFALMDLGGLAQLTALPEGLTLFELNTIESLDGLEALQSVGVKIRIVGNPYLVDIDALYGVEVLSGELLLYNNMSLPSCDAFAFEEYVVDELAWEGSSIICGNLADSCDPEAYPHWDCP